MIFLLFAFVFLFFGLIFSMFGTRIVPHQEVWIIQRLGRFQRRLQPGLNWIIPTIEKVAYRHSLKEEAMDVPEQTAITQDNVSVILDGIVYIRIVDPVAASYGVKDPFHALTQLVQTTMRSEIGKIALDKTFEEREALNRKMVEAINRAAPGSATATDGRQIKVVAPLSVTERVAFPGRIENLDVTPMQMAAKVIINARTGSVVMNQSVTLDSCAVAHGSLSVTVNTENAVSQPNPLSAGQTVVAGNAKVAVKQEGGALMNVRGGANLSDVVKALNAIGANPQDLISILQAMKSSGALRAELEII